MTRHIGCLSFDYDAVSSWIVNGRTTPTSMSRGEFGEVDTERVLELLKEYNIPSTWFVPGIIVETYPRTCGMIADAAAEFSEMSN